MINEEVPPKCDPLGPDNKLIFAPGILSGTPLVNTSRLSIGAKSPLTGTIKESNVGGTVAAALGVRVLKAEREFNRKAGFTKEDDRLPRFFYEEPLPPHNTVFSLGDEEIDRTFDF